MLNNIKVIVAHPAQQHSYKTAVALKKAGYLYKYATTVYSKKKSLTTIFSRLLRGDNLKRAHGRNCNELDDADIIQFCELEGLVLLFLRRIDRTKYFSTIWSNYVEKKFNRKIAKYAEKMDIHILVSYDTASSYMLEILEKKKSNIIKIIDMSAPNVTYMDNIFMQDLNNSRGYSNELRDLVTTKNYNQTINRSAIEMLQADYFLVASSFTYNSLNYCGIKDDQIFLCPYGITEVKLQKNEILHNREGGKRKMKCIFVGRVTQQKGVFYLFDAIKKVNLDIFSFSFIGSYDITKPYYTEFGEICTFEGHVTKDKMAEFYKEADILIFPSLADGFGLSVLEALSFGVPVICSSNAGASDLITNGYNGFIVPASDGNAIVERLLWFSNNKEKFDVMRDNARESVEKYTWENYNQLLKTVIEKVVEYHKN